MKEFFDEDPRVLYQRLKALLRTVPPDRQPPETQTGPGVDLHFCTFLECVHKYSQRLQLKYRTVRIANDDILFTLEGQVPGALTIQATRH